MIGLLVEVKEAVEKAETEGRDALDPSVLHSIRVRYGRLIQKGRAANPAPESGKRHGYAKKAHDLLERLDHHRADVLVRQRLRSELGQQRGRARRPHGEGLGLPALGGGARSGDLSIDHWRWAESDTR